MGHIEIQGIVDGLCISAIILYFCFATLAVAYCRKNVLGYKFAMSGILAIFYVFCYDALHGNPGATLLDMVLGACAAILAYISYPRRHIPETQPEVETAPEPKPESAPEPDYEGAALSSPANNYRRRIGGKYFLSIPFRVKESERAWNAADRIKEPFTEIPETVPGIGRFAKEAFTCAEICNFLMFCDFDKKFHYSVSVRFRGPEGKFAGSQSILMLHSQSLEEFDYEAIDKFIETLFDNSFDGWDLEDLANSIERSRESIRIEEKNIEWITNFIEGKPQETDWLEFINVKE